MKLFQLIALAALTLSLSSQAAMAEVGREFSVDEIPTGSVVCEITGRVIKRHTASAEPRGSERKVELDNTGAVRSSM